MSTPPSREPVRLEPWYLRPRNAIWLGPLLIIACVALRFGWRGLAGPPWPFWGITYLIAAAGVLLTYVGFVGRSSS